MGDQETTDWGRVPGGAIRPLSLHFADPRLEAEFDRYRSREAWRTDRIWSLCAVGFYAFYGLVEYFVLPPELFLRAAVFRYALVLPVMLAALLHTLFRKSSPRQVALRAVALVAVHVAAITLLLATPYPASEIYYLLALLTYVFTQAFTFMRFAATALIGGLAAPFYLASIVWLNPMPGPTAFAFAVVLLSVILTSLFNQHTHEVAQRREFRSRIALERQVHHSAALAETAEASSAAKSNFLAMMSHELRTPLNAILGFTQMIEQQVFGPIGESRYLEYVRDIGRSGRHLLRIINDILDLSQAEAGKMMLREEEVNVAQAIDQSLTLSAPGADETLAAVSLAVMRDLPRLRADPIKLRQMLVPAVQRLQVHPAGRRGPHQRPPHRGGRHRDRGERYRHRHSRRPARRGDGAVLAGRHGVAGQARRQRPGAAPGAHAGQPARRRFQARQQAGRGHPGGADLPAHPHPGAGPLADRRGGLIATRLRCQCGFLKPLRAAPLDPRVTREKAATSRPHIRHART